MLQKTLNGAGAGATV